MITNKVDYINFDAPFWHFFDIITTLTSYDLISSQSDTLGSDLLFLWGAPLQNSETTEKLEMLFECEVNSVLFPSAFRPKSGLKVINGFMRLKVISQKVV